MERLKPSQLSPVVLPLNQIQQRYAHLYDSYAPSRVSQMTRGLRLYGRVDHRALQRSLQALLARHDLLRAGLARRGTHHDFAIAPEPELRLPSTDLSHLPSAEWERHVQTLAMQIGRETFCLDVPPLLRAHLFRAPDHAVLLLTLHHLIADGWSMGLLIEELAHIYASELRGEPASLPIARMSHSDLVRREQLLCSTDETRRRVDWWGVHLRDCAFGRKTRLSGPDGALGRATASIPASWVTGVGLLASSLHTRLSTVFLALYMRSLADLTSEEDVLVKDIVLNRTLLGDEHAVTDAVDVYLRRASIRPREGLVSVIRHVAEVVRQQRRHHLPLWYLIPRLSPESYLDRRGPAVYEFNMGLSGLTEIDAGPDASMALMDSLWVPGPWAEFDRCLIIQPSTTGSVTLCLLFNERSVAQHDADAHVSCLANLICEASRHERAPSVEGRYPLSG